jgi:hypothetical protein
VIRIDSNRIAFWSRQDGAVVIANKTGETFDLTVTVEPGTPVPTRRIGTLGPVALHVINCVDTVIRVRYRGNGLEANGIGLEVCQGVTLERSHITGAAGNAALVGIGNTGNRYEHNKITALSGKSTRGMWIGNVHDFEYERDPFIGWNDISGTTASAIATVSYAPVITGNRLIGSGKPGSGIALAGSSLNATKRARVTLNLCRGWGYHGIQSDPMPGSTIDDVLLDGNLCEDNYNSGVYVHSANNWLLHANQCFNNGKFNQWAAGITLALDCTRVRTTGNECRDNPLGLWLDSEGTKADCTDSENILTDNPKGNRRDDRTK